MDEQTEQVNERVKQVMAAVFGIPLHDINETSSPDDIANWDSLRHMNLVVALEEEFEMRFSEEDVESMLNLKIIRHIITTGVAQ